MTTLRADLEPAQTERDRWQDAHKIKREVERKLLKEREQAGAAEAARTLEVATRREELERVSTEQDGANADLLAARTEAQALLMAAEQKKVTKAKPVRRASRQANWRSGSATQQ